MSKQHNTLIDADIHVTGYVQASDPGAIGSGKMWIDTSGGTGLWVTKSRNTANDGWESLSTPQTYPGAGIALSTGSAWGTSITDNSANWNTAYGWGNHASLGYLTAVVADSPLSGSGTAASHLVVDLSGRQPLDADLTAIAALGFVSTSFLKKTAADTWTLDTSTYLDTTTAASTYVPYTGATADVDLGIYGLTLTDITIGANTLDTNEWAFLDGQDQAVKTTSSPIFTGHVAIGANSSVGSANLLHLDETHTAQTGTLTGISVNPTLSPAGALSGTTILAGVDIIADWDSAVDGETTDANIYAINAVAKTLDDGATGDVHNIISFRCVSQHRGSGTVAALYGAYTTISNDDTFTESGNVTNAYGYYAAANADKTTGTIGTRYGFYAADLSGGGNLTTQYGLYIEDMTAATNDYGIVIAGADTQVLWLSSAVDTTDAANGIAFGASRDTNLYRSAANELKTDDLFTAAGGLGASGVVDFGGATSTEIANGANPTCDAAGEIAVNTTDRTLEFHDGTVQVALSAIKIMQGTFDLAAQYDVDSDLWLVDLHTDQFPHGIYITKIYVDCTVADPTTELDANLMYCDAVANGAFPGANATLIKAIDTTTGNFADAAVNTAVATGKSIYIDIDADPTDANTMWHIRIHYYIPTSQEFI